MKMCDYPGCVAEVGDRSTVGNPHRDMQGKPCVSCEGTGRKHRGSGPICNVCAGTGFVDYHRRSTVAADAEQVKLF